MRGRFSSPHAEASHGKELFLMRFFSVRNRRMAVMRRKGCERR